MKKFVAERTEDKYLNLPADSMKIENDAIIAYLDGEPVAYLDVGCVLCAYISEKAEGRPGE